LKTGNDPRHLSRVLALQSMYEDNFHEQWDKESEKVLLDSIDLAGKLKLTILQNTITPYTKKLFQKLNLRSRKLIALS
jgi:hypothetical protein